MNDFVTQVLALARQTAEAQARAVEAQMAQLGALEQATEAGREQLRGLQSSADDWQAQLEALQTVLEADTGGAELIALKTEVDRLRQQNARLQMQVTQDEQDVNYRTALTLTLANAAYDALLVVDEQQRIIAINASAEALFQRPQYLHETLIDVTGSEEIEAVVQEALNYQEEMFEEQVTLNKRVYRVRAQMVRRAGNPFIALALQDISELVRLNRARRDMVANISHELRTPIANIRIIIESLFHEQDKPKRKQSTTALRSIAHETDSLLWLVQELLDLSMIESGQAILRMVEVPAELLVSEAIERLLDQSDTKEVTMEQSVPPGLGVLCDRDQARRVLINLLHNAIKWSPANGVIRVEVADGDEEVTFAVLDEGPGVSEEHTERIFERFYQVDVSRSKGEGTGLGLAICKHIVEAHGGRIWAESNANGGGRFLFTLPKAEVRVIGAASSKIE